MENSEAEHFSVCFHDFQVVLETNTRVHYWLDLSAFGNLEVIVQEQVGWELSVLIAVCLPNCCTPQFVQFMFITNFLAQMEKDMKEHYPCFLCMQGTCLTKGHVPCDWEKTFWEGKPSANSTLKDRHMKHSQRARSSAGGGSTWLQLQNANLQQKNSGWKLGGKSSAGWPQKRVWSLVNRNEHRSWLLLWTTDLHQLPVSHMNVTRRPSNRKVLGRETTEESLIQSLRHI